MITRWLVILMLLAQPLVNAAEWVCCCPTEPVAEFTACCSDDPKASAACESCACGCTEQSDHACATAESLCDAAHLAVCPTLLGRSCPECECSWRPGFPNAPIPARTRQVSTNHWTLPPPTFTLALRPVAAFERTEPRRSSPASWLARCGTSIDRRVALSSWTT